MHNAIFQVELLKDQDAIVPAFSSGSLNESDYYEDMPYWANYMENLEYEDQLTELKEFNNSFPFFKVDPNKNGNVFKLTNENALKYFIHDYDTLITMVNEIKLYPEKFTGDKNYAHNLMNAINYEFDIHIKNDEFGTISLDDFVRSYRGVFAITKVIGYHW